MGCSGGDARPAAVAIPFPPVRLTYAENRGAFLGLGDQLPPAIRFWILTVATGVFLAALLVDLVTRWQMPGRRFVAVALLVSGGLGNLIDRVANDGRVIDFINLGVGPLRTGIFNVADIAIVAGALLLMLSRSTSTKMKGPGGPPAQ